MLPSEHNGENWKIDDLTSIKGVEHVVIATSDGLAKMHSGQTGTDDADRLAAACSALQSIFKSLGQVFGTGNSVEQVVVGFPEGYIFLRRAGDGSSLAVVTGRPVDPALVGQEMTAQVLRVGAHNLATPARAAHPGTEP